MPGERHLSYFSPKITFFRNKINEIRPRMNLNGEKDLIYPTEYTFKEIFDEFEETLEDRLVFLELALMSAVHNGDTNLVRYLLNFNINGTPVHALTTEEGILWKNATFEVTYAVSSVLKTLLGEAAHCGHLQVVKCLVNEFNIDVNAYSASGYTALHEVVQGDGGCVPGPGKDHGLIVDFLMKSGANPALKSKPRGGVVDNTKSQTPLEMTECCKPKFLDKLGINTRTSAAYDADRVRPVLEYYENLTRQQTIKNIKPAVEDTVQQSFLYLYPKSFEHSISSLVLEYLAFDVDSENLNKVTEEPTNSINKLNCLMQ